MKDLQRQLKETTNLVKNLSSQLNDLREKVDNHSIEICSVLCIYRLWRGGGEQVERNKIEKVDNQPLLKFECIVFVCVCVCVCVCVENRLSKTEEGSERVYSLILTTIVSSHTHKYNNNCALFFSSHTLDGGATKDSTAKNYSNTDAITDESSPL